MILEKTYTATVDVRDPDNFCADPQQVMMNHLRQMYEGRCCRGAHILEVLEILRRSRCVIKDTLTHEPGGEGYVDVEFRARVSVLAQWDILTGVEIMAQAPMLVGHSKAEGAATVASFLPSAEARAVGVGQLVAMRVVQTQYNPFQEEASAVGVLLTCDKTSPAFRLAGRLTPSDAAALAPLANRVKHHLEARSALYAERPDDSLFFEELLYSYAAPNGLGTRTVETAAAQQWSGPDGLPLPQGAEAANLLDLVAQAAAGGVDVDGVWARDLSIPRSAPLTAKGGTESFPANWPEPTASAPRAAFASMLKTVHEFLKAVGEMVELFSTPEALQAHKNVWLVMRQAQLPPP